MSDENEKLDDHARPAIRTQNLAAAFADASLYAMPLPVWPVTAAPSRESVIGITHIFATSDTVERWMPTMRLRQRAKSAAREHLTTLEQKWTSTDGREEWRPIEVVIVPEGG